ncbi:integrase [Butyrivibrio sp. AC2005]|uniref:integrase n=1 Tax=Butyrivibrio sp. AC2005 TaxID=1280672 RepID=UPI00041AD872|nr:integrase [Butyrivibrio sp. AC2005]
MSENSQISEKVRGQIDIIEDDSFSYEDFQVVRGEFFAHVFEPSITFSDSKVYVNTACVKKLPETDYIQILINKEKKKLVVRPCNEDERDSFRWCSATAKRSPKQVTCRPFFAMLCDEMGWDPNYRYKFLGKMIKSKGESIFLFDLSSPEIYLREITNEGKVKNSRKPSYPEQWKNQFGIPVSQHAIQTKLNVFDGYTVITIADDTKKKPKRQAHPSKENATQKESPVKEPESTTPPTTVVLDALGNNASPPTMEDIQDTEDNMTLDDESTNDDKEPQYEQMAFSNVSS